MKKIAVVSTFLAASLWAGCNQPLPAEEEAAPQVAQPEVVAPSPAPEVVQAPASGAGSEGPGELPPAGLLPPTDSSMERSEPGTPGTPPEGVNLVKPTGQLPPGERVPGHAGEVSASPPPESSAGVPPNDTSSVAPPPTGDVGAAGSPAASDSPTDAAGAGQ